MTNFAERLVLRGAGLDTGDASVALRPRPRHRFEPTSVDISGAVAGETEISQEPLPVLPAEVGTAAPATAIAPRWNGDERIPDNGSSAEHADRSEPRSQVTAELAGWRITAMPPPADSAAASSPRSGIAPEPAQSDDTVSEEKFDMSLSSKSGEPAPLPRAAPVALRSVTSAVEAVSAPSEQSDAPSPTGADVVGEGAAVRAPAREEFGRRVETPNDAAPPTDARVQLERPATHRPTRKAFGGLGEAAPSDEAPSATEPSVRPISVSIGRIDVEFAQPPATPPARVGPERTHGFDAYARVRRGLTR